MRSKIIVSSSRPSTDRIRSKDNGSPEVRLDCMLVAREKASGNERSVDIERNKEYLGSFTEPVENL